MAVYIHMIMAVLYLNACIICCIYCCIVLYVTVYCNLYVALREVLVYLRATRLASV